MARFRLKPLLTVLALLPAGCEPARGEDRQGSVTVKLPPPRPATPAPGFRAGARNREPL